MTSLAKGRGLSTVSTKTVREALVQVRARLAAEAAREEANRVDEKGRSPLWHAACAGDSDEVDRLLEAGADVNQATQDGATPLLIAAGKGHEAVLGRLSLFMSSSA
jgi:ankyrin repeat protein